jgi:large subunit ribosomal protein L3
MNQHPGVFGRKLGMTQIFIDDGTVVPCTVVEAKPMVVGKRTQEKDGYDALVLGLDDAKDKHVSKPVAGQFKKAGVAAKRHVREFRCSAEHAAKYEVGQTLKLDDLFEAGQIVDVRGVSRGRGFSGVMRRHHFAGAVATHGSHEYKRHGGSIGTNMTPGRVKLGMKMPGQHGNAKVSVLNQKLMQVLAEEGVLLVRGGIPGPRDALVEIRGAIKRRGGKPAAK